MVLKYIPKPREIFADLTDINHGEAELLLLPGEYTCEIMSLYLLGNEIHDIQYILNFDLDRDFDLLPEEQQIIYGFSDLHTFMMHQDRLLKFLNPNDDLKNKFAFHILTRNVARNKDLSLVEYLLPKFTSKDLKRLCTEDIICIWLLKQRPDYINFEMVIQLVKNNQIDVVKEFIPELTQLNNQAILQSGGPIIINTVHLSKTMTRLLRETGIKTKEQTGSDTGSETDGYSTVVDMDSSYYTNNSDPEDYFEYSIDSQY